MAAWVKDMKTRVKCTCINISHFHIQIDIKLSLSFPFLLYYALLPTSPSLYDDCSTKTANASKSASPLLLLRYKENGRSKFEKSWVEIRWQSSCYFHQLGMVKRRRSPPTKGMEHKKEIVRKLWRKCILSYYRHMYGNNNTVANGIMHNQMLLLRQYYY